MAYGRREPAAEATFVRRSPECPQAGWWVDHMHVRARYRGAGFEIDLVRQAEEILARGGAALRRSRL